MLMFVLPAPPPPPTIVGAVVRNSREVSGPAALPRPVPRKSNVPRLAREMLAAVSSYWPPAIGLSVTVLWPLLL